MALTERYFAEHETPLVEVFGQHLLSHRQLNGAIKHVGALSVEKPNLKSNEVRLPHLVVQERQSEFKDKVIWERLSREDAEIWLGGELPDMEFVENHLDGIQAVKKMIRDNLVDQIDHEALRERLRDRYLSILFVYKNIDVMREILK